MGWIYLVCRSPVELEPAALAAGLRDGDPDAPAGVDYPTLAEDYPVGALGDCVARMERALDALEVVVVEQSELGAVLDIRLGTGRPLTVHRFDGPSLAPVMSAALGDDRTEVAAKMLIGVRYWREHGAGPGIVIAYEAARYLAQRADALVVDDVRVAEVRHGAWVPSRWPAPRRTRGGADRYDPRPGGPILISAALEAARDTALAVSCTTTEAGAALAQVQLACEISAAAPIPPEWLDVLADQALDDGGVNSVFLPAEWLAAVRRYLASLPAARASALILPQHGVRWRYVVDRPTPEVVECAVADVAAWPRITDVYVREQARYALARVGARVVAPAASVLGASRPPQRLLLAVAVASSGARAADPVLRGLLRDPNDRVAAVAAWGLTGPTITAAGAAWCAGCGILDDDSAVMCPWCGRVYRPVEASAWRALAAPSCPVPLGQR